MTTEMEGLITVREAARRCRRSPETIRRWIWDGKLPARKVGNQLFILAAALPASVDKDADAIRAERLAALEVFARIREELRGQPGWEQSPAEMIEEMREERMQELLRAIERRQ